MTSWRFSLRMLMIAVTVVAVCLCDWVLWQRAVRFLELYDLHSWNAGCFVGVGEGPASEKWRAYHADMAVKYLRAARYPWFPVEPDPPAPDPFDSDKFGEPYFAITISPKRWPHSTALGTGLGMHGLALGLLGLVGVAIRERSRRGKRPS